MQKTTQDCIILRVTSLRVSLMRTRGIVRKGALFVHGQSAEKQNLARVTCLLGALGTEPEMCILQTQA